MIVTTNYENIKNYFSDKSKKINEILEENSNNKYLLISKNITHSDLISSGKRLGKEQSIEKNLLYYLSKKEMYDIEDKFKLENKSYFQTAKQSNISINKKFFEFLGIPILKRREGKCLENHKHINICDFSSVYIVTENINYFTSYYTKEILNKLDKLDIKYINSISEIVFEKEDELIELDNLSYAIHGIGTSKDKVFQELRKSIFKGDILNILVIKKSPNINEVYIFLEKNPIFYKILNETNQNWIDYLNKNQNIKNNIIDELKIESKIEKDRIMQNKWKQLLAKEMMNYTINEDEVFCPLTMIRGNFKNLKTLYRASHIKSYSECENLYEAYDINNGLLLVANADALFDKHMITISEDKELLFSFLIKNDKILLQQLKLNQEVFKEVLNDKRMEYLKEHRKKFFEKEEIRKRR